MASQQQDNILGGILGPLGVPISDELKIIELVSSRIGLNGVINKLAKLIHVSQSFGKDILNISDIALQDADEQIGRPFVDSFLNLGLGLDAEKTVKGTRDAIKTMRMMIGFCIVLAFSSEGIKLIPKIIGANRISDTLCESIAKIPEEMGISWALGMILNSAFEQSVGQEFEEWINKQKHPARLNIQELMRLLRQHKLPHAQVYEWLDKLGYPDDLKNLLNSMDYQQLPITDAVAARLAGMITDSQLQGYIQSLGFQAGEQRVKYYDIFDDLKEKSVDLPSDARIIWDTYVTKAQTQAGDLARTIARKNYLEQLMTDDMFRDMLRRANVPEQSIEQELSVLKYEIKATRELTQVNYIKRNYLAGTYGKQQAVDKLEKLGMSSDSALLLMDQWVTASQVKKPALSPSKIVNLYKNTIIDRNRAYNLLTDEGYYPNQADMMLQYYDTKSNSGGIPLTVDNVKTAYTDKIIDIVRFKELLVQLGFNHEEVILESTVAEFNLKHGGPSITGSKALTLDQLQTAWDKDQISDLEVITLLEEDGYASTDSEIIWAQWYHDKHGVWPPGNAPNPSP